MSKWTVDEWTNYGDVEYVMWGGKFARHCPECSDSEIDVLLILGTADLGTDEDEGEIEATLVEVDISDVWIDETAVSVFAGFTKEEDPLGYAVACVDYYGPENFGSYITYNDGNARLTRDQLRTWMNDLEIED